MAKTKVEPGEPVDEEELDDDTSDEDDDSEDLDEIDELMEAVATLDSRVMSLDRGFASFMRAITVILGDIDLVLSPTTSPEGKAAAQQRTSATVASLKKALEAQAAQRQSKG